jgi:hypothetical protein
MARKLKTYQTSLGFFDLARRPIHESGCGSLGFEDGRFQARFCEANQ